MSQRGFTLPEMMLVLLLIGVSASMVLLAFPSARTPRPHRSRRAFRRNWILSASAGSKPVSSSALSSTLSAGSLCACNLPTIAPRRRLTTGGATRSGCRCRPDASPRRKPSRGRADAALSRRRAWTPGEQPDVLIFPGGEVTPFQLRIDAAMGINVDAGATASRWRRGSSHEA